MVALGAGLGLFGRFDAGEKRFRREGPVSGREAASPRAIEVGEIGLRQPELSEQPPDVSGRNGASSCAVTRSASHSSWRMAPTRGSCAGSLASVNGAVSTMYLLAWSSARQIASSAAMEGELRDVRVELASRLARRRRERQRRPAPGAERLHRALEVPLLHRERAAHEVAEVVGEVGVEARDERRPR